jgi:hypothetical protein
VFRNTRVPTARQSTKFGCVRSTRTAGPRRFGQNNWLRYAVGFRFYLAGFGVSGYIGEVIGVMLVSIPFKNRIRSIA